MAQLTKKQILARHKAVATGLFFFMAAIFLLSLWLQKNYPAGYVNYLRAFSEAAMVGALADWFAVTALFRKPLGLPIPHTNLIESSKQRIGDNLGNFVVDNFLNAKNIRPYIERLKVSALAGKYLQKPSYRDAVVKEILFLMHGIVHKLDEATVSNFIAQKAGAYLSDLPLAKWSDAGLRYLVNSGEHQPVITLLANKIKDFIAENEKLVQEKVHKESYFFIPSFVDRKLASKISNGLVAYFDEIANDPQHRVRQEIEIQILSVADKFTTDAAWELKLHSLKNNLLTTDKINEFSAKAVKALKQTLLQELETEGSVLQNYISSGINDLSQTLATDEAFQIKIDSWIRYNAYRIILNNRKQAGILISSTVGNWQGRELSEKLEEEVGKDLQFIRINGTLVGGLVGLALYAIAQLFG